MKDFYSKVESMVDRWCKISNDAYSDFYYRTVSETEDGYEVLIKIDFYFSSTVILKGIVYKDMRKRASIIDTADEF